MTDSVQEASFSFPDIVFVVVVVVGMYPVVLFRGCKSLWESKTAISTLFSIKFEANLGRGLMKSRR